MTSVSTDLAYTADELDLDLRWWSAANYLTVAQIYLQENALLQEPLQVEHIKPRLLGHWGTSPGLSMIYAILNRQIKNTDSNWLLVTGPGHGGPAIVASIYLEGTYSEVYPRISSDSAGIRLLCRQFSTPGGIPSHVSVQTPGSVHEGGELGYALMHAAGAAFDHPDLTVACVIGDGEAETAPLAGSWKLPAFLNTRRDGAVLPILHLNGAKISGPTVLGRTDDENISRFLTSQGWSPIFVEGDQPELVFPKLQAAVRQSHEDIRRIQESARSGRPAPDIMWPAIVLRTPKGWTGPHIVDGHLIEGTNRSHQVPIAQVRTNPDHLRQLEKWMRSYKPETLFDANGSLLKELRDLAPEGDLRLGATPYANGGRLSVPLRVPPLEDYALDIESPGTTLHATTKPLGELIRDIYRLDTGDSDGGGTFRLFCPDETTSNKLGAVFEATDRCWQLPVADFDDSFGSDGRVMEVLSEHLCEGWLEGYLLTGRHGIFASYEAFAKKAAEAAVSASPADGVPSQIAYLTRVLKTPTIGRVWEELADHARDENWSHEEYLAAVLGRQLADRESAGTIIRIRTAHFPAVKTLEDFNLDHLPSLRRDVLAHLATGMFVPKAENVILLGPPGIGRTHIAIGLGVKAAYAGYSVLFDTASNWITRLSTAHHAGQLETELKKIRRYKLIIIDEVGYIAFDQDAANLFFQLIASRYEQGSVMVTSNLPFGPWGETFSDDVVAAAMIDRLVHHAEVLTLSGDSYRTRSRRELLTKNRSSRD